MKVSGVVTSLDGDYLIEVAPGTQLTFSSIGFLDVNAHNISGSWKLAQWNGAALNDSTYMYVEFVRNDKTFTIYQNLDSFMNVPHKTTGSFYIDYDMEYVQVIERVDSIPMAPAEE